MRLAAFLSLFLTCNAAIAASASDQLPHYRLDSPVVFPILTKNAPLAVAMTCIDAGSASSDPRIYFEVTNRGASTFYLNAGPIWEEIALRVYDPTGKLLNVNGMRFFPPNLPMGSIVIPAGKSVPMHDLVSDDPIGTHIPLSHFGFYHLPAGSYKLVADATDPAVPNLSDSCTVAIR